MALLKVSQCLRIIVASPVCRRQPVTWYFDQRDSFAILEGKKAQLSALLKSTIFFKEFSKFLTIIFSVIQKNSLRRHFKHLQEPNGLLTSY